MKRWIAALTALFCLGSSVALADYEIALPQGQLQVRLAAQSENEAGQMVYQYEYALVDTDGQTVCAFSQESVDWAHDPAQGGVTAADVNFDGHIDLALRVQAPQANDARMFFLWDEENVRFEPATGENVLSWYTLYPDQQVLVNRVLDGTVDYRLEMYAWDGMALRCLRTAQVKADAQRDTVDVLVVRHDEAGDYPLLKGTLSESAYRENAPDIEARLADALWKGMNP